MSLQLAAQHLASKGRGPDTTLVHMAPHEVAGLQALARAQGGSLTINPDTGLAEAGFLSDLFKAALPMAAGWALGPAGFGLMSSLGAGAAVGGISALASGSLSKGITAGLGAYGGSELATGLGNFGDATMGQQAAQAAVGNQLGPQAIEAAAAAPSTYVPGADKLGSVFGGAKAAISNPSAFAGSMGGWGGVAKPALMAAAPLLSLAPKTEMPNVGGSSTGYIRPFKFDSQTQRYTPDEPIRADQYGSRMAAGGTVETTTKMPAMTGDSSAAYNYLMGLGPNPLVDTSMPKPKPVEEEKAKATTGVDAAGAGIGSLLPVIREGGNDAGQPGGGWGAKDVSDKAAFFAENKSWADLHEKMLNMTPFDTQAKRDEQLAIDMSRTIGPSTTTPEEQATKNTLADQMRAAEHETEAKAAQAQADAVAAAQANAAAQSQAAADAASQVGAQAAAAQAAADAATSAAAPTASGYGGYAGYGREGDSGVGGGFGGVGVGGYGDGGGGGGAEGGGGGGTGSGGPGDAGPRAYGGMVGQYAFGGLTALAQGGMSSLGGYSDGGRLLRGPGDGVSDSIPAHIGRNMQPAQLADGEFVVPARIVSELGNGSTEAGARQLYKMMERIQAGRAKTTGKNKVAVNSRAAKHLPA